MLIREMPQGLDKSNNLLYFNGRNIIIFFKELYNYNKVLLSKDYIYRSIRFILKNKKKYYKELIEYNAID